MMTTTPCLKANLYLILHNFTDQIQYFQILHTTSFNTKGEKGIDSASGRVRKLSSISPGSTTVVAPKMVGSITTKGQMKPTVVYQCPRQEWTAKPMIQNIRLYPVFQQTRSSAEITGEEQYCRKHHQISEEGQRSSKAYQNSKSTQYQHQF